MKVEYEGLELLGGQSIQVRRSGMALTISPLTERLGAEAYGVDLSSSIDEVDRNVLCEAFLEYHVLVVREQSLDPPAFKRAAQVFGQLQFHENAEAAVPGHPDVNYVSNYELSSDGEPIKLRTLIPGFDFHTDHSNHPQPPKATTLYAVKIPPEGGDTQFVNAEQAYEELPSEMKDEIDSLEAVHAYLSTHSDRKVDPQKLERMTKRFPPSTHPLVRVHPETGRRALYLNPTRIETIVGLEDEAALRLLRELLDHVTQERYEYRHKWRLGDMVVWDNRSVMHKANGDYDMQQHRYLYQLLLEGDKPRGIAPAVQ